MSADFTPDRQFPPAGRIQFQLNKVIGLLAKRGISLMGTRLLSVRGRTSGRWRSTAVNLLVLDGERYLVSPRGRTQWVRNMRAAGGGELRLGRRTEAFT